MESKLTRYLKYRKINKYLKSKDESYYNCLDNILKYYVEGHFEKLLNSYDFSIVEVYPEVNKKGNLLQVYYNYFNLVVFIQFDDDKIDYAVYLPGISGEELNKCFISKSYSDDFKIEKFFEDFHNMLQKDSRLK